MRMLQDAVATKADRVAKLEPKLEPHENLRCTAEGDKEPIMSDTHAPLPSFQSLVASLSQHRQHRANAAVSGATKARRPLESQPPSNQDRLIAPPAMLAHPISPSQSTALHLHQPSAWQTGVPASLSANLAPISAPFLAHSLSASAPSGSIGPASHLDAAEWSSHKDRRASFQSDVCGRTWSDNLETPRPDSIRRRQSIPVSIYTHSDSLQQTGEHPPFPPPFAASNAFMPHSNFKNGPTPVNANQSSPLLPSPVLPTAHSNQNPTTTPRTYTCTFPACNKSFAYLSILKTHTRVHTGLRPHVCTQCPRAYTTASRLKIHTRTHTREAPYSCTACGKRFRSNSNLAQHARVHLDAPGRALLQERERRTVACPVCRKLYRTEKSMDQHLWRAHVEKVPVVEGLLAAGVGPSTSFGSSGSQSRGGSVEEDGDEDEHALLDSEPDEGEGSEERSG